MSTLDLFKRLPHLNSDIKVVEDWDYAPCLYYFDGEWHVSWIDCMEGDSIINFYGQSPEKAIQEAFDWCVKLKLL